MPTTLDIRSSGMNPVYSGKVRDGSVPGNRLLLVATDRLSALMWCCPTRSPAGRDADANLNFWFAKTPI